MIVKQVQGTKFRKIYDTASNGALDSYTLHVTYTLQYKNGQLLCIAQMYEDLLKIRINCTYTSNRFCGRGRLDLRCALLNTGTLPKKRNYLAMLTGMKI